MSIQLGWVAVFFFLESEPQKSFSVGIRSRNFPKALRARPEYLENHSVLHSKVCAFGRFNGQLLPSCYGHYHI
jgi:hypothetical protein